MPKNLALKIAIIESDMSQMEVAKAIDLHDSRLSRIVNGHDEPTPTERRAIARILKRKVVDLFPGAEEARP